MNFYDELLMNRSLAAIIIFMFFFIIYLMYRRYKYREKSLRQEKEDILHIFSQLSNHPVVIFSDTFQVIYANEQIQKIIQRKQVEALDGIADLPLFLIENREMSLREILALYRDKRTKDTLQIANASLVDKNESRPISLRVNGVWRERKIACIGIAVLKLADHTQSSDAHYTNTYTGLPNHHKAMADIGLMAQHHAAADQHFAAAVISIDNFLEIVSIAGYMESLQVISLMAKYLQAVSVKNNFKLYHIARTNFLLILPNIASVRECSDLVEKYKTDCEALLHNNDANFHYTISSGIGIYRGGSTEDLISDAYKALRAAKKQGLGYTMIAETDLEETEKNSPIKYSEVKKALEQEEFSLYYQPIYDTKMGKVTGAEALIRWTHPTKGIIPPGLFLPLVEKTGFMKQLGEFVAKEAIGQLGIWKKLGFRDIQVSINFSLREFETMDYSLILDTLLRKNNISASQLKIEVTENIAMSNVAYSTAQFAKLQKLGIAISLDDFGTGYSSFSMLETFPIDTLKIDKSFVDHMSQNKDRRAIVAAIITMSHALGIKVIAEGIEDEQTVVILKHLGCDYMQGYHLGKPMPVFEFQELIRSDSQVSNTDDIIALSFND